MKIRISFEPNGNESRDRKRVEKEQERRKARHGSEGKWALQAPARILGP